MTTLTLYGLKNCDTCKKAQKALEAAGKIFNLVDIRTGADLTKKVPEWLAQLGPAALVNKRSTTWRNLPDGDRALICANAAEAVLIEHPPLIKRPVIETGGIACVGWTKDVQSALT